MLSRRPSIVAHETSAENAHEAGKDHQFGVEGVDQFDQGGVEGLATFESLVIQRAGVDSRVPGALQTVGVARLEITAAMRTGLSPVRVLSIRACKLLPVPDNSTTTSQVAGISAP